MNICGSPFLSHPLVLAIEADPTNPEPKMALGDLLMGEGEKELGNAYLWLARHNKFPHHRTHYHTPPDDLGNFYTSRRVAEAYSWAFYSTYVSPEEFNKSRPPEWSQLHYRVFPLVMDIGYGGDRKLFRSHFEAVQRLGKGLKEARELFEI